MNKKSILFFGSDHAGFDTKKELINLLIKDGYECIDVGCLNKESCNYAEYAIAVGNKVITTPNSLGIVVCGTGVGVCMAANKVEGVLCGLAYNANEAKLIKEHDNCNVLALGAREFDISTLYQFCLEYLNAQFQGGRHEQRVEFIKNYEKKK